MLIRKGTYPDSMKKSRRSIPICAPLVFKKIETNYYDEIEFKFCNSKSLELFGFDIQKASLDEIAHFDHKFKRVNKANADTESEKLSLLEMI